MHHTHQHFSFITGWRRPYMINWNAPTSMVGINFLAVCITSAACLCLSSINSKHFDTHSWTSDVNIWSGNAARIWSSLTVSNCIGKSSSDDLVVLPVGLRYLHFRSFTVHNTILATYFSGLLQRLGM